MHITPQSEALTSKLAANDGPSNPLLPPVKSPRIYRPRRCSPSPRSPRHVETSALLMSSTHFSALQHHPHWPGRNDATQGTNVRGMITSARLSKDEPCPTSGTTDQVDSSSTNNEDDHSPRERSVRPHSVVLSRIGFLTLYQQPNGAEIRRLIVSGFKERSSTTSSPKDDTTSRYFDGIL